MTRAAARPSRTTRHDPAELRAAAISQNERDAAAGRCTRFVEDVAVLAQIAALVAATTAPAAEGGGADAAA